MAGSPLKVIIVSQNDGAQEVSPIMDFDVYIRTRDKNNLQIVRFEVPTSSPEVRLAHIV